MKRATLLTLTAVMLLSIPTGLAEWKGRGFYEPDTKLDRELGFMFANPDTSPTGEKVYFSAYASYYVATVNHNLATVGSNVAPYPTNIHFMLGAWKDCNKDGYVGQAETALLEYRSELLVLDTSVCPAKATPSPIPQGWFPSHNDGQWVREFLWIGPDHVRPDTGNSGCFDHPTTADCVRAENNTNPFNVADESARIWADWGLPSESASASCPINPRPRGTYQSTGGLLRFVDCPASWRITGAINNAVATANSTGVHALDVIAFSDSAQHRPDESNSILNQKNPYGQQSDASFVEAWDCNADPTLVNDDARVTHFVVEDPTSGDPLYVNASGDSGDRDPRGNANPNSGYTILRVNQLRGVPSVNSGGSAAGTLNSTLEGANGDCDRSYGAGENSNIYDLDEADFEGTTPLRVQNDVFGLFYEGTRNKAAPGSTDAQVDQLLGIGRPPGAGEGLAYMQEPGATYWFGTPGYAVSRNPYVNRDTLALWGVVEFTAYAKVNPALGLTIPGGSLHKGTYGSAHCSGLTPITGAWECNGLKWWLQPDGNGGTKPGRNMWQAVNGDTYNLLDVDCLDATIAKGTPSATGTAANKFCAR